MPSPDLEDKVKGLLEKYVGISYAGAVLAVLLRGEVEMLVSTGYASLSPEEEMKTDTLFDLASLTKPLSLTMIAMRLVEEGIIDLEQPVHTVVPEFASGPGGPSPSKEKVKLWMLLTHTSGLPPWAPLYRAASSRREVFAEAFRLPLYGEPGARCVYSDIGFIVATAMIERATGERLDKLFEELVAKPLELKRTMYNPLEKDYQGSIAATERDPRRGGVLRGRVHDENAYAMDGVSGHAGLFSTAEEVGRLAWSIADSAEKGGFLSRPVARAMLEPWTREGCPYGLGWRLYRHGYRHAGDLFSPRAFGHTGFTGTSVWVDPEYGLTVVLLTNRVHLGRGAPIAEARARIHNVVLSSLTRRG